VVLGAVGGLGHEGLSFRGEVASKARSRRPAGQTGGPHPLPRSRWSWHQSRMGYIGSL
jgi:hypothetical protein